MQCLLIIFGLCAFFFIMPAEKKENDLSQKCISNGYPEYRFYLASDSYCIKLINGTQFVVNVNNLNK